jgi:hypothetical protein
VVIVGKLRIENRGEEKKQYKNTKRKKGQKKKEGQDI